MEPLSPAVSALSMRPSKKSASEVMVVGLGPVGMAALMLCRAMGAEKLIGVEMNEYRIKMVQDMGLVDHIVRPSDNAVEEIRALTGGHGVEPART